MKKHRFLSLILIFAGPVLFAQQSDFTPHGKSIMRIFSNYNTSFSDGNHGSAFEIKRAYLGYQHHFSENLSGTVVFDVGNPGVGKLQMTAYVKNAYLKYKKDKLTVNLGMISTTQFKVQEKAWGYRYVAKSFQDEFKFNSSADIGASVAYQITDFLSADLAFTNGEGYKKIQADSAFRTGFGLTMTPIQNLTVRAYYDVSTKENTQSSLTAFVGYAADKFSLGAEYMQQWQPSFVTDRAWSGISLFSTVTLTDDLKVFARFDQLTSNTVASETTNWNLSGDGQWYIAGLQYSPVKGIKLAPNFQLWTPADDTQSSVSTVFLNIEVKF